jgi:quaternary ammonium compound-resistance protein SugE
MSEPAHGKLPHSIMSPAVAWMLLCVAGALEVTWLVAMKYSNGFTKLWPTVGVFALGTLSFYLLSLCLKVIPVGTAYVVWTGIGAVGGAVVGMLLFAEPRDGWRIASIALVVAGIVGLKLTGSSH